MPNVFENAEPSDEYEPPIGPPPSEHPLGVGRNAAFIVGVFQGEDGSMGFRYNERYELIVSRSSIRKREGGPWVPYGSLEAFFRNWIVTGRH